MLQKKEAIKIYVLLSPDVVKYTITESFNPYLTLVQMYDEGAADFKANFMSNMYTQY